MSAAVPEAAAVSGVANETPGTYSVSSYSLRTIAASLGVSAATVSRDLRKMGTVRTAFVEGRDGKVYPVNFSKPRIIDYEDRCARIAWSFGLAACGFSLRNIAAWLGISHETVRQDVAVIRAASVEEQEAAMDWFEWLRLRWLEETEGA